MFDPGLTISNQISSILKRVKYHLLNLSRLRRFMDEATYKLAVQLLIFSRTDYVLLLGAS